MNHCTNRIRNPSEKVNAAKEKWEKCGPKDSPPSDVSRKPAINHARGFAENRLDLGEIRQLRERKVHKLDSLDRRLLRELQRDCSLSAARIGERCGTTESTALRRLNRLRRAGVISSEVAVVDAHKVGRGLMLFVRVRLEREDKPGVSDFVEHITAHPDVQQFFFVTGTADYVILLCVRSMEDYDRFLHDHLVPNPLVIMSDTNVVIRPLKMSLAVPIDEPSKP